MRGFLRSVCCGVLVFACAHANPPASSSPGVFGAWKLDPVLTTPVAGTAVAATGGAASNTSSRRGSGGTGGAHGGGMGGSHGGGGRHGGGHRADAVSTKSAASALDAEQRDPGLERAFATQMTITPLAQRIRFDDGGHVVELDRDGTNISGPNVGGTIALGASKPDIVVDALTDTGYTLKERYHLSDDGRHLELHVSLKGPGGAQAQESVRVFDRVAATPANAPPPAH